MRSLEFRLRHTPSVAIFRKFYLESVVTQVHKYILLLCRCSLVAFSLYLHLIKFRLLHVCCEVISFALFVSKFCFTYRDVRQPDSPPAYVTPRRVRDVVAAIENSQPGAAPAHAELAQLPTATVAPDVGTGGSAGAAVTRTTATRITRSTTAAAASGMDAETAQNDA